MIKILRSPTVDSAVHTLNLRVHISVRGVIRATPQRIGLGRASSMSKNRLVRPKPASARHAELTNVGKGVE